jgi:hypothetical protein
MPARHAQSVGLCPLWVISRRMQRKRALSASLPIAAAKADMYPAREPGKALQGRLSCTHPSR